MNRQRIARVAMALLALAALLWPALLLASCATFNARTGTGTPVDVVAALEQGWHAAGLPSLAGCHLREATVYQATDAQEFAVRCGAPVAHAASCLTTDNVQRGLRVDGFPVAVLRPGLDDVQGATLHELIHWAEQCALGTPDAGHRNPRVWSAGGGRESAQGRAAALLR